MNFENKLNKIKYNKNDMSANETIKIEDNKNYDENIENSEIIVKEDEKNERIDSFLAKKTNLTRTRIQQLIKDKNILINEKTIKSSYKIEKNDKISIYIPQIEKIEIQPENIKIDIIYEDSDIVVINKYAGIVVHPANGHYSGTLVNAIMYHIKDLSGINGEIRPGIVHRLDKDTSGLIVIAKNDNAHIELARMFQEKKVKKIYYAITKGKMTNKKGKLITRIGRDKNDRKKMAVLDELNAGKIAITNYTVVQKNEKYSLVEINIETGRTHQIRVHMKYMGYPILGDRVYGRVDIEKRQMLHAYMLEFEHPITKMPLKFFGKLPEDFIKALKKTKLDNIFNNEGMLI